jgi:hypothetical protein
MAKFKTYDYRQRVLLPVSLEDQLMPGTLEFAIHNLVEKRLDMAICQGKYRNEIKVNIQWLMFCLVLNIEKILNYGLAYT